MSRRSMEFAHGVQKFSWDIRQFEDSTGRQRYKAQCKNYPSIVGLGDDEQQALRAAQQSITKAAESAELGTDPPTNG